MARERLEVELGINNQEFNSKLDAAKGRVKLFSAEFVSMGAGVAAAGWALKNLAGAFLETEQGARVATAGMAAFKQVWVDLMNMNKGIVGNVVGAWKAAKEAVLLREDDRQDLEDQKRVQVDINKLMYEAADQTKTISERITSLTEAKRLQQGLSVMMNVDAQQELKNLYAQLAVNTDNTKVLDAIHKKKLEILDIEGRMIEYRRLESQLTGLQKQQEDQRLEQMEEAEEKKLKILLQAKAIQDQYKPNKALADIYSMPFDTKTLVMPITYDIDEMNKGLKEQERTLESLSDTFASYFSDVNVGFQSMVESMITGIQRLAMQLAAKAAFLAILGILFPKLGIIGFGKFGRLLFGEGLTGLGSLGSPVPVKQVMSPKLNFDFKIYGRDMAKSLRRN